MIILLIFSATAALSEQSPPKETAINNDNVSPLFNAVYQGQVYPDMAVQLEFEYDKSIFTCFGNPFLSIKHLFIYEKSASNLFIFDEYLFSDLRLFITHVQYSIALLELRHIQGAVFIFFNSESFLHPIISPFICNLRMLSTLFYHNREKRH